MSERIMKQTARRIAAETVPNAYERAEKRLYLLPDIIQRIEYNKNEFKALMECDMRTIEGRSKSLVRLNIRPGVRTDLLQAYQAHLDMLEAYIAVDTRERNAMKRALRCVRDDPYYLTIEYKYFRRLPDEKVAEALNCALSTVRRNRANLVRRIAAILYGCGSYC